ncbi:hypothetical protein HOY82DRAFT_597471 [Tuber indicum]|nr:hypothetical protein HOY82DRAFT_597471 [Tuber indicum]
MPLLLTTSYDAGVISDYISCVLMAWNLDNAYAVLTGVQEGGGPIFYTLVFGTPASNVAESVLPPTPYDLPTLVNQYCIVAANGFETMWNKEPVYNFDNITLRALSIAIEVLTPQEDLEDS